MNMYVNMDVSAVISRTPHERDTSFTDRFKITHLTVRFCHGINNECEAVFTKKNTHANEM